VASNCGVPLIKHTSCTNYYGTPKIAREKRTFSNAEAISMLGLLFDEVHDLSDLMRLPIVYL
jgi:hypothetical protein